MFTRIFHKKNVPVDPRGQTDTEKTEWVQNNLFLCLFVLLNDTPVGHHAQVLDILTFGSTETFQRLADDMLIHIPDVLRIKHTPLP